MKYLFFFFFIFLFPKIAISQVVISGFVTDNNTGEPLPGAAVYDKNSALGSVTNIHGFFSLKTKSKEHSLVFSFVGYSPKTVTFRATEDTSLTIQLLPDVEIEEVIISSARSKEQTLLNGLTTISTAQLDAIPTIGGEKDLLKAITVLPGVMEGREGFSSLFVRGGSSDQNLFILDDAPVYNSGHLFNFISVFNAQAIKKVDLYKNNYPARYGGKLSSVVDIMFKDGNKEEFSGVFDLGLINSKLLLEGPLGKKKKTSFLLAARSTYLDLFNLTKRKQFRYNAIDSYWGYTFYDINGKISHEINKNNKVFLSFFRGQDYYRTFEQRNLSFYNKFSYNLLNTTLSLNSYHILTPALFLKTSASYVTNQANISNYEERYRMNQTVNRDNNRTVVTYTRDLFRRLNADNSNKLEDFTLNVDFTWQYLVNNSLNFGMSFITHKFEPSLFSEKNEYFDSVEYVINNELNEPAYHSVESGYYIENTTRLERLQFITGLRLSTYKHKNAFYYNFEPRLSASYKTGNMGSFQASYTRMQQYNHALNRNDQVLDMMVWVPSTEDIPPQLAHQYSLGYALSLPSRGIGISLSSYFKRMKQLSFYKTNYSSSNFYNWQQGVLTGGNGKSYGIEMDIDKHGKNFNAKVSYCLSWNFRQFDELNGGKWYPYLYDRRHVLTISGNYKLNDKWRFKALWTISSGHRINFPDGKAVQPESRYMYLDSYYVYNSLNNRQLPAYHRLDIGAERIRILENQKELVVSFNIYNAYYQKNTNYLYIDYNNTVKSVSFIPILPTINITYKF